jgi:hypothetical protein
MNSQIAKAEANENGTVRLHIGARHSKVWLHQQDSPAPPDALLTLELQRLHARWHAHQRPSLEALELAIDVVEEQIMAITKRVAPGATLVVSSEAVDMFTLIHNGGSKTTNRFTTEQVEEAFSRLVVAASRPGLSEPQSSSAAAASLLILREFMHHGGFVSVDINQDRNPS